jgi:AGZA family xanthine/uracil permease-like MFS transporter
MAGGFVAPWVRKVTPRAALLGTLAGVSIAFISMRPAQEMFMTPVIGVVCFAIILASWFGGVRYFKGIPAGLVAIAVGSAIAWGSTALGLDYGGMSLGKLAQSVANFGFSVPVPAVGHIFSGFQFLGVILVTAPVGDSVWSRVVVRDDSTADDCDGQKCSEDHTARYFPFHGLPFIVGCCWDHPGHVAQSPLPRWKLPG